MARFTMLYPLHPILHIHVAHVGLLLVRLLAPITIGRLKNEVVENKHRLQLKGPDEGAHLLMCGGKIAHCPFPIRN